VGVRLALPDVVNDAAVGGGVKGVPSSATRLWCISDIAFKDGTPPSGEWNTAEKSAVFIENRIGGRAGAM
jgi:hypothetical protein